MPQWRVDVVYSSWKAFLGYPSEQAWRDASGFADELSLKVLLKPAAQGFGLAVGLALPTIIAATRSEYVAEPSWLLFVLSHFGTIYAIHLDVFSSTYSVMVAFVITVFSWSCQILETCRVKSLQKKNRRSCWLFCCCAFVVGNCFK